MIRILSFVFAMSFAGTAYAEGVSATSPEAQAPTAVPSGVLSATPEISPSPGVEASPVPSPSPTPETVTPDQAGSLLREFKRAQVNEIRAATHRHAFELKELKASQKARKKEWLDRERQARREFFKSTEKGAEKRAWMHDHQERRKALEAILKDEYATRAREQKVHKGALVEEQKQKLKEFQEYLEKGLRPPQDLWPKPGV